MGLLVSIFVKLETVFLACQQSPFKTGPSLLLGHDDEFVTAR